MPCITRAVPPPSAHAAPNSFSPTASRGAATDASWPAWWTRKQMAPNESPIDSAAPWSRAASR